MTYDFQKIINNVYAKTKHIKGGHRASYIPSLAHADPKTYGLSLCDLSGQVFNRGDHNTSVAIESISKLFTLAAAVKSHGTAEVFKKIGMHGSFLPFNSILAAKLSPTHTINPFLNQGAMATTSLLVNKHASNVKRKLLNNMSAYAGRKLALGKSVYKSESQTNAVNKSLAYLLHSEHRFYAPVEPTVDAYTYQCSVRVTSDDLARMASVLANGGHSPVTGKTLLSSSQTAYILNNLLPEGLYEFSDDWIMRTGGRAYAKSGVGGGLLIVIPGVCGIGIVSPRLDSTGNSVRGIAAGILLAKDMSPPMFPALRKSSRTRRFRRHYRSRSRRKT